MTGEQVLEMSGYPCQIAVLQSVTDDPTCSISCALLEFLQLHLDITHLTFVIKTDPAAEGRQWPEATPLSEPAVARAVGEGASAPHPGSKIQRF